VAILAELNAQIAALEAELGTHFETHLDADIYLSLPGLGVILGARVLGEFGDDPNRYTTAKSRKNYAETSPLTVARERNTPWWPATSATDASTTPSTNGPSAH
jgi:transposase